MMLDYSSENGGFLLWIPGLQPDSVLYRTADDAASRGGIYSDAIVVWLPSLSIMDLVWACISLGEL